MEPESIAILAFSIAVVLIIISVVFYDNIRASRGQSKKVPR